MARKDRDIYNSRICHPKYVLAAGETHLIQVLHFAKRK